LQIASLFIKAIHKDGHKKQAQKKAETGSTFLIYLYLLKLTAVHLVFALNVSAD